ncbi:magnesium transporter CorA family protein [Limosilactobacillus sp. RRLNB_1_1]|uniref:Magnesium transporter CorA family protein n=1 Tax=Limosilactobacillus albertensis TaxID=2759752 RepID=A0A7W3TSG9_9LACO|nr:magnesium transporter CorA family protein [Limosilactobacillus albertensis]MBB1070058.1 magnesium transporter CorA family protein [Limosilactobacillus albertensis]MBB1124033.1 magnesium transporter CorA family protein [Limosilactobacillus albertensis]MCD7117295.1 magnesium transporter CorA family protein [Limosilactobacillus albertensis]MCD7121755.1 magnesium transporter CorA family protein [Limosilactobacillus albertensis]MCD7128899.1 magnesium transporter CorA family protein [Limosilactob
MLTTEQINDHSKWISIFEPLPHERLDLIEKYEVTQELLDYAIDPYEKARVEIDQDAGVTLLIFDVYVPTHAVTAPQTAPIGIMLTANNIITFTNAKTNFVNGIVANQLQLLKKHGNNEDKLNLVFPVLYRLSTDYFGPLRRADQQRQEIQRNLQRRTGRQAITQFMEIETGLVYILTSLKGNVSLLEEFKRRFGNHITTKQYNDLDDVIIEAQQGLEMAQMTSDVSARVSNAYSKVLDSDLNQTMKYLTIYSIVLSIPTIVSGFYGENVKLPLANGTYSWVFTIFITLVLMLACVIFLINRHWWK